MNSWDLGTVFGIRIRIHWTFLLLPIWIFFSSIVGGAGMVAAVYTVGFVLAIFGCVLLHELGHALAARQFNIPTRDILLLPIGGVASLERMPRNPLQELWIAVAGPLVNVVIATVLFTGLLLLPGTNNFLWSLAVANVVLVLFNLIPAFPMDGGRILRSILAMFMDWLRATQIAVTTGKVAAIAFGLLGLLSGNLMLILIGVFVFFAAQSEMMASVAWSNQGRQQNEQPFFASGDIPVGRASSAESVPASAPTRTVAAWLANRQIEVCRVVEAGRTIGTVTRGQLLDALARGLGNQPVGHLV